MEKLRLAYFSNATTADAINRANLALMSDLEITDGVLKAMALQANANSGQKNTFLFRFWVWNWMTWTLHSSGEWHINFIHIYKQIFSHSWHRYRKRSSWKKFELYCTWCRFMLHIPVLIVYVTFKFRTKNIHFTIFVASIFRCHAFIMYDKQSAQFNVIRRLVKMITNFARTG